jgi:REP element-mobilizing transposase RayT
MSRADGKGDIFLDDVDRQDFLKTLAEACVKTGFQVHAHCLMRNHFHLVVETPNANLVAGMRWLLSTYTIRLNHRHKLFGHVFSGRYKALVVDGSGNGYLRMVCDQRRRIMRAAGDVTKVWLDTARRAAPAATSILRCSAGGMADIRGVRKSSSGSSRSLCIRLHERPAWPLAV